MKLIESANEKIVLELTDKDFSILFASIQGVIQYYDDIDSVLLEDHPFEDFDQIADTFTEILKQIVSNHEKQNI